MVIPRGVTSVAAQHLHDTPDMPRVLVGETAILPDVLQPSPTRPVLGAGMTLLHEPQGMSHWSMQNSRLEHSTGGYLEICLLAGQTCWVSVSI